MCGVNSYLSDIGTPRMLSSLTRFTSGSAGGMLASFIARRGRRTITQQILAMLSERLLAVAHAETLPSSAGMVCELDAGTIRYMSSAYLSRELLGSMVFRSEALRTYAVGPVTEHGMILALMASTVDSVCSNLVKCFLFNRKSATQL